MDPEWLRGAASAARVASGWWGYAPQGPDTSHRHGLRRRRSRAVALAFSAGADSTYTLLRGAQRPQALVNIHGFDIPLAETERHAGVERVVRAVAAELGLPLIVVRTNLREHPSFAAVEWERTHGGALAAVGHLLSRDFGTLLLSATFARGEEERPWGSHYKLDPCWSSAQMRLTHVGDDMRRMRKVAELADEPIAQRHLVVCWEHRTDDLNCSRCDKCLITMVILHRAGRLERFATLDGPEVIAERLGELPHTVYTNSYGQLTREGLPGVAVQEAAERLLERTLATVGVKHA